MIEIKKACTVALMKAKNFFFLVGRCRQKKKKKKMVQICFLKHISVKWTSFKVNDMLLKVD